MENIKVIAKEKVNQTDLLQTHSELLTKQIYHLSQLAQATKRIDDFNRMAYQAQSGMSMPEDSNDKKSFNEFQDYQQQGRDAVNDMYYSDISLSGQLEEG